MKTRQPAEILERVEHWQAQAQDKLADFARDIVTTGLDPVVHADGPQLLPIGNARIGSARIAGSSPAMTR
jgi:hypothetical protein